MSTDTYSLQIPNVSHESAYTKMMDRWEALEQNIQPELLRRYSNKLKTTVPYAKWLEWCEDDRTTGSNLSTKVPCTLYFFMKNDEEILGCILLNHSNTHRGHLHAGIAPWNRNQGYGTKMLELALQKCRERGFSYAEIVTNRKNIPAIHTILYNGGNLTEEFYENNTWSQRYRITL